MKTIRRFMGLLSVCALVLCSCSKSDNAADSGEGDGGSVTDEIAAATSEAKSITATTAVLGGYLTTGSAQSATDVGVQYVAIGTSEVSEALFDDKSAVSVPTTVTTIWSVAVSGLRSATDYAFRAFANNDNGTVYGEILQFTTATASSSSNDTYTYTGATATDAAEDVVDTSDSDTYWENSSFTKSVAVVYNGTTADVTAPSGVVVDKDGAYVTIDLSTGSVSGVEITVSGSTTDGALKIYSPKKFKLTLSGATICSQRGPAINNQGDKRTFVHVSGTTYLRDAASYVDDHYYYNGATSATEDRKACFFSEPHLIFSGDGVLCIEGKSKHALASDDTFYIRHGVTLAVVDAISDGIHTNDGVTVAGGLINIMSAGGDGIECEDGAIAISAGKVLVSCADDAIAATYADGDTSITPDITISGGELDITTSDRKGMAVKAEGNISVSGGTITATVKGDAAKCLNATGNITLSGGTFDLTTSGSTIYENSDTSSAACIKSDGNITIASAVIAAKSSGIGGKGINCGGMLTIDSGTLTATTTGGRYTYGSSAGNGGKPGWGGGSNAVTSSPKAIKSDGNMVINGGKITVSSTKSGSTSGSSSDSDGCEGIESKGSLTINGGEIEVTAADDGINAATAIAINGGKVYSYSSNNDGIDSNGTLTVTGGVTITCGTTAPEEGFDCDQNTFKVTGGVLIGIGGATSNPTTSVSTQRSAVCSRATLTGGQTYYIGTAVGAPAITFRAPRTLSNATLLLSSPQIASSASYGIYQGGTVGSYTSLWNGYYEGATVSGGSKQSASISIK